MADVLRLITPSLLDPAGLPTQGQARRSLALLAALLLLLAGGCDQKRTPSQPPATDQTTDQATDPASNVDPAAEPADNPELATRVVIDAHVHMNVSAYPSFFDIARDAGIARIANLSGGYGPDMYEAHRSLPPELGDRVAPFMNIDWTGVEEAGFARERAQELEEAVANGYAGIKVSKALGLGVEIDGALLAVDDPRLDPIWAKAGELGVPVAIHTADPRAFFEPPGPQNERHAELSLAPSWSFHGDQFPSRAELLAARDRLVARHPETTFILVHFANNPEDVAYVDTLLGKHPNALVDISARVAEIGRHDPATVRDIFVRHAERILFATDLQYSVGRSRDGRVGYRLTLGSISENRPRIDDIIPFYRQHFAWLEQTGEPIAHPVPIQGEWKVSPVDLPPEVLERVYFKNAERAVFAPWLARKRASGIVSRSRRITSQR